MKEISIALGYKCNNWCVFCTNIRKQRTSKAPTIKHLKNYIGSLAKGPEGLKETKLVVSGGEPLIFKDLFELLSFAKNAGLGGIQIQTNGRMLCNEALVKKLKKFEPIDFFVSLHFPNKELYKKYCNSNGFYQAIKGIRNLVKYNCILSTNTVVMKPNIDCLENIAKLLIKEKVSEIRYRSMIGDNAGILPVYRAFSLKYSKIAPIFENIMKKYSNLANIKFMEFPFCVLGKRARKSAAYLTKERKYLFPGSKMETKKLPSQKFVFFAKCKKCSYKKICRGVRKEYAELYGIKEFKPIT